MSEKLYAWLLRLFPTRFQQSYGKEALQLVRDRARDETGLLPRLRLWFDLCIDLAVSLPGSYRKPIAAAPAASRSDGTPCFSSLEDETLSPGSIVSGGIASLIAYGSILLLLSYGGKAISGRALNIRRPLTAAAPSSFSMGSPDRQKGAGAVVKPRPKVTLEYLPAHLASGATVTLIVKVAGADGGPTPSGFVRFYDGDTSLDLAKLTNGSITTKEKLPRTPSHSLNAIYLGDDNYSAAGCTAATD